ncbi:MFS transporter [Flavihumibacter rivuli]|uniref:MFS transporter n=1 Tax=Flavihumibacter rivuli TaxID=2838156 RepID=UPI001BDDE4A3|nr:MFS transporter [Flavihumibacter rivuli]ULQ56986.1 MFS transporter [Flavihumibacter rivuli]
MDRPSHPIYNVPFGLLCLSSLLFSASFNMLIPELPAYLSSLGGAEYKGLIIALFTLTAGFSRPFSGKLTDTIGRVPVMAVGSIVCFICGFLYPVLNTVAGFLFIRLVHGFSTGFKPTATAAYVADIVPSQRWGEALGIHGLAFSTGMAIGPAIGSTIVLRYGINALFYSSSVFALLSILILVNMKETKQDKQSFMASHLNISRQDILDPRALPAGIVTLLTYVPYGVVLTLIPDWSGHIGVRNKGLFFVVFTLASLLVRFVAGRLSDKKGRVAVIIAGTIALGISLLLLAWSSSTAGLIIGSLAYGVASGILSPAINAWTIDLSLPEQRGRAMATMYISLEAGIGLGALLAGWFFADHIERIPSILLGASVFALLGLVYVLAWRHRHKPAGEVNAKN